MSFPFICKSIFRSFIKCYGTFDLFFIGMPLCNSADCFEGAKCIIPKALISADLNTVLRPCDFSDGVKINDWTLNAASVYKKHRLVFRKICVCESQNLFCER